MKSFVFDVWGPGVLISEQLSVTGINNTIIISNDTLALINKQFTVQPLTPVVMSGMEFGRFAVVGDLSEQFSIIGSDEKSQVQSVSSITPTTMSKMEEKGGDELYGVYAGTGDVVDREYALAQGFIPVDDDSHTSTFSAGAVATSSGPTMSPAPAPINMPVEMVDAPATSSIGQPPQFIPV